MSSVVPNYHCLIACAVIMDSYELSDLAGLSRDDVHTDVASVVQCKGICDSVGCTRRPSRIPEHKNITEFNILNLQEPQLWLMYGDSISWWSPICMWVLGSAFYIVQNKPLVKKEFALALALCCLLDIMPVLHSFAWHPVCCNDHLLALEMLYSRAWLRCMQFCS